MLASDADGRRAHALDTVDAPATRADERVDGLRTADREVGVSDAARARRAPTVAALVASNHPPTAQAAVARGVENAKVGNSTAAKPVVEPKPATKRRPGLN